MHSSDAHGGRPARRTGGLTVLLFRATYLLGRIPAREAWQGSSLCAYKAKKLHHRRNGGKDVPGR
eukprot:scaffold2639_cov361-Pavlova_lutheri.AAC.22